MERKADDLNAMKIKNHTVPYETEVETEIEVEVEVEARHRRY